jgi:hypothetical protein
MLSQRSWSPPEPLCFEAERGAAPGGPGGAFLAEDVLTTLFVFAVLRAVAKASYAAVNGLASGLCLRSSTSSGFR